MTIAFPSAIYRTAANVFGAGFLSPLTTLQKKIALIATIVFLAAGFWIKYSFFNFKPEIVEDLTRKPDPAQLLSYLAKYGKKVKELNLFTKLLDIVPSKDQFLKDIVARCPNLEKLNLELHMGDDAVLEHLKALSSLKILNPHFKDISTLGLKHLGAINSLEHLDLSTSSVTDAGLLHLISLDSLQSLNLSFCKNITGWGLQYFQVLPHLNSLNLSFCQQFSDAGLQHVRDIKSLKFLNIRECKEISDAGLKHLMNYPMKLGGAVSDPRSPNLHLKLGTRTIDPYLHLFNTFWHQRNKITYQTLMHLNWFHDVKIKI